MGDWDGHVTSPDGPPARVEFRLAGNGSALVERLFPGTDHEMVSIYHLVGSDLVLTHYCAMANQPRMKLVAGGTGRATSSSTSRAATTSTPRPRPTCTAGRFSGEGRGRLRGRLGIVERRGSPPATTVSS